MPTNDYNAHITAVTAHPIAITIAAGGFGWQLYGGGIYGHPQNKKGGKVFGKESTEEKRSIRTVNICSKASQHTHR